MTKTQSDQDALNIATKKVMDSINLEILRGVNTNNNILKSNEDDPVLKGLKVAYALANGLNDGQYLICFGENEDEVCNFNGCKGIMVDDRDGCCYCHISPPCGYCTAIKTYCLECGREYFYQE